MLLSPFAPGCFDTDSGSSSAEIVGLVCSAAALVPSFQDANSERRSLQASVLGPRGKPRCLACRGLASSPDRPLCLGFRARGRPTARTPSVLLGPQTPHFLLLLHSLCGRSDIHFTDGKTEASEAVSPVTPPSRQEESQSGSEKVQDSPGPCGSVDWNVVQCGMSQVQPLVRVPVRQPTHHITVSVCGPLPPALK